MHVPQSDTVCPLVAWILISITFVFSALLEYFLILLRFKFRGDSIRVSTSGDEECKKSKVELWAKRMDLLSLVIFPAAYFLAAMVFFYVI